ncbi:hypothetical protein CN177_18825 [Sinorhizobium meliloti]|nr:hypothetical protein CN219_21815 [Sinorhizobium meliloti]RVI36706.1 hypothetical protein CN197_10800 [Sinorhizobium meliloti]RVI42093.1 hypothetical protein CN196_23155 [Sinorhizobium meliloti]RVJ22898.1 hypothetical protein CN177_18825 [Sinorhizobium meliloti]RVJ89734.1 hypothetical protein CN170_29995 [Sinorhizobium meliloti]
MGNRLLSFLMASVALGGLAEAKTVIHVMHQGDPGWVSTYGEVLRDRLWLVGYHAFQGCASFLRI